MSLESSETFSNMSSPSSETFSSISLAVVVVVVVVVMVVVIVVVVITIIWNFLKYVYTFKTLQKDSWSTLESPFFK